MVDMELMPVRYEVDSSQAENQAVAVASASRFAAIQQLLARPVTRLAGLRAMRARLRRGTPRLLIIDRAHSAATALLAEAQEQAPALLVLLWPAGDVVAAPALFDLSGGQVTERAAGEVSMARERTARYGARPELHNPRSGRLDANQIAAFFGWSLSKLAKLLRRSPQAVHKTPDAPSLQQPLALYARIASALLAVHGASAGARIWLNAPQRDLDHLRPLELIERRKGAIVAELLEDRLLGHPG